MVRELKFRLVRSVTLNSIGPQQPESEPLTIGAEVLQATVQPTAASLSGS